MPPTRAHRLRICCAAVAFWLVGLPAAGQGAAPSPLGLNRDQVIERYGEPKSQIAAGNRLVMFFARERLVLRDGVVIEVERLASEPVRRPPPAPVPAAPAPSAAPQAETAPATAATDRPAPAAATAPTASVPAPAPVPEATEPAPAPEPRLEIKSVRPPSANYSPRPIPKAEPVAPPPVPAASVAAPATKAGSSAAKAPSTPATKETTTASATVPMTEPRTTTTDTIATTPSTEAVDAAKAAEEEARAEELAAAKAAKEKKFKIAKARRKLNEAGEPEEPDIAEAFLTTRTFVIGLVVIGGGIWFLFWRNRQRQLELAASAVSHAPFSAPVASSPGGGAVFTAELLSKLEWKRFEELVVAYYVKTGVVAVRTKTGPASPVHIKISWKGEPRPFACVQCIAHPQGLVDAKSLQDLFAVLTAEDIRRGYVVSRGKFSVNARDYAEEKHLTLLPGDIFLEKLNALPDTARNEIMQTVTTGDYQTPSCPKCDARMVHSTDDPAMWRCPSHADQLIPTWR